MVKNVVVIVIDCLRLDYSNEIWDVLSKYGFYKMDFAVTTAPWTIPAHASMLTGLYPSEHGAHESKNRKAGKIEFKIKDNLVNDLKRRGYTTYLFTANAFLTERFGFGDFDHIYFNSNVPDRLFLKPDELRYLTEETLTKSPLGVLISILKKRKLKLLFKGCAVFAYRKLSSFVGGWPKEKGISKIIKKIRKTNFKEPFFIFMNIMELHEPYRSNNVRAEYEAQLRYLKRKFEKLMEVLNDKGILDNSLVIVTSDHGQLLGERGRGGHGVFLDDELIKVPFFIRVPNGKITKFEGYISHANLRRFVIKFVDDRADVSLLFSKVAFAESFGSFSSKIVDPKFERHKVAVFYKGCKGIYDVESHRFEDIGCPELKEELELVIKEFLRRTKQKRRMIEENSLKEKIRKLKRSGRL